MISSRTVVSNIYAVASTVYTQRRWNKNNEMKATIREMRNYLIGPEYKESQEELLYLLAKYKNVVVFPDKLLYTAQPRISNLSTPLSLLTSLRINQTTGSMNMSSVLEARRCDVILQASGYKSRLRGYRLPGSTSGKLVSAGWPRRQVY